MGQSEAATDQRLMTETVYIHIGAHKTGSSSIQQSFFKSAGALKEHGVEYFPLSANHSAAIYSFFSENRKNYHVNLKKRLSNEELKSSLEAVDFALKDFLQSSITPKKLISGEDISLLTEAEVGKLHEYISKNADLTVKIIIYVRNFYEFLDSTIQELVKAGTALGKVELSLAEGRPAALPRYRFRIEKFIKVFGRDNVIVRVFDTTRFKGGDLLADFCEAIETPALSADLTRVRVNNSVSDETVRILSKYNEVFPLRTGDNYNPARTEKVRSYFDSSNGSKFRVADPNLLATYETLIADDKEFIRECLGDELAQHVLRRRSSSSDLPTTDRASLDLDYLFQTLGRILLDLESYEHGFKVALAGLLEDGGGNERVGEAVARNVKFMNAGDVCRRLGRAFIKKGKLSEANVLLERALELNGENAENHVLKGDLFWRQEDWGQAEQAYRRASVLDPDNSATFQKLGRCLRKLGRPAQAADAEGKMIELSENNALEPFEKKFRKRKTVSAASKG